MIRTASLCSIFLIVTIRAMAQDPSPATTWLQALGPVPALEIPASPEAWASKRSAIRSTLTRLLGDLPARPTVPQVKVLSKEDHDDYSLEKFEFENGAGEPVRGYCFLPAKATNCPAILYCHWHGGQYDIGKDELLQTNAVPVPPGPALAKAGSTDSERLVDAMKGLPVGTPFGTIRFRALDHQSTMGAYVGRTALRDGKGVMVNWRYADGADHLPSDEAVKAMRPAR